MPKSTALTNSTRLRIILNLCSFSHDMENPQRVFCFADDMFMTWKLHDSQALDGFEAIELFAHKGRAVHRIFIHYFAAWPRLIQQKPSASRTQPCKIAPVEAVCRMFDNHSVSIYNIKIIIYSLRMHKILISSMFH